MGRLQATVSAYKELSDNVKQLEKEGKSNEALLGKTQKEMDLLEREKLFSGRWDNKDAIVSIYAGAGGQDAADWAHMLYAMYCAYAQRKGWKTTVIHASQDTGNESTGRSLLKNISFEISAKGGDFVYGHLKYESGVHRLVRVSPFSSQQLRHTSFALVEVVPVFEERALEIDEKDIKVDFFRSSGPGGQNVNKVETAVRLTHIPTGVVVSVQTERSQAQNRERAMRILEARLITKMEQERVNALDKLKTNAKPEWGSQIRSYVLNPYKMVKDHRTDYETSQVNDVLEGGELDGFIEAELVYFSERKENKT